MSEDRISIEKQIQAHKQRLQILEERAAVMGLNTPPEIQIEINSIKEKIESLNHEVELSTAISTATVVRNDSVPNVEEDTNFKYYIYISISKVDFMFAQLPRRLQAEYRDEALITKLNLLINYLEAKGLVGDIKTPNSYFKGAMPMKWGNTTLPVLPLRSSEFTLCGGRLRDKVVLMGGYSMEAMREMRDTPLPQSLRLMEIVFNDFIFIHEEGGYYPPSNPHQLFNLMRALDHMVEPEEQLEVFAKTLFHDPNSDPQLLLGTPLYIAMT